MSSLNGLVAIVADGTGVALTRTLALELAEDDHTNVGAVCPDDVCTEPWWDPYAPRDESHGQMCRGIRVRIIEQQPLTHRIRPTALRPAIR
jgi:hypothetical protein